MTTILIILAISAWVIGAVVVRMFLEIPPNHNEPLFWKMVFSVLWPIVVPMLCVTVWVNNFLYDRRMKKMKDKR